MDISFGEGGVAGRSPAKEPSRLVIGSVLGRCIDELEQASSRLREATDPEALHDTRVALRQLRSNLRIYTARIKDDRIDPLRTRLGELAGETAGARDAEVQLAWLRSKSKRIPKREQDAFQELCRHLEEETRTGYGAVTSEWFLRLQAVVCDCKLLVRDTILDRGEDKSFGRVFSRLVAKSAQRLEEELGAIDSRKDHDEIHDARLMGKRLRYLLAPFSGDNKPIKQVSRQLRALQDRLGGLNDNWLLKQRVHELAPELGEKPGYHALLKLIKAEEVALYGKLRRWLRRSSDELFDALKQLEVK